MAITRIGTSNYFILKKKFKAIPRLFVTRTRHFKVNSKEQLNRCEEGMYLNCFEFSKALKWNTKVELYILNISIKIYSANLLSRNKARPSNLEIFVLCNLTCLLQEFQNSIESLLHQKYLNITIGQRCDLFSRDTPSYAYRELSTKLKIMAYRWRRR